MKMRTVFVVRRRMDPFRRLRSEVIDYARVRKCVRVQLHKQEKELHQ